MYGGVLLEKGGTLRQIGFYVLEARGLGGGALKGFVAVGFAQCLVHGARLLALVDYYFRFGHLVVVLAGCALARVQQCAGLLF